MHTFRKKSKYLPHLIEFHLSFQGNATILFKRNLPENEISKNKLADDSDYVNLETHKTLKSQHSDVRCSLPQEMQKSFDLLIKESENGELLSEEKYTHELDHSDKKVRCLFRIYTTMNIYLYFITASVPFRFCLSTPRNVPLTLCT